MLDEKLKLIRPPEATSFVIAGFLRQKQVLVVIGGLFASSSSPQVNDLSQSLTDWTEECRVLAEIVSD